MSDHEALMAILCGIVAGIGVAILALWLSNELGEKK